MSDPSGELAQRSFKVTMSRQHTCRLCQATVADNRVVSLFSPGRLQRQWASRITDLLGVSVRQHDSLSHYICRKCTRRIEGLERAMEDLRDFRKQAQESHESLALPCPGVKRAKEASGSAISPDTAKAIPRAKRSVLTVGRRLDFEHISSTESEFMYNN